MGMFESGWCLWYLFLFLISCTALKAMATGDDQVKFYFDATIGIVDSGTLLKCLCGAMIFNAKRIDVYSTFNLTSISFHGNIIVDLHNWLVRWYKMGDKKQWIGESKLELLVDQYLTSYQCKCHHDCPQWMKKDVPMFPRSTIIL